MTEQDPLHDAERSDARPLTAPEAPAASASEASRGAAAASWLEVKRRFEPRVRQAGLDSIPEPDSAEFPHFLAQLNALDRPLSLELVATTRRLRQELEMPSSRASRRRERKRATRRLLFMRQTPDGRWVADKSKAPFYGIFGLLLTGGLLTAVYAMPRLNGTSVVASASQTTPAVTEEETGIAQGKPSTESEAALSKSRKDLARFRSEQAAKDRQSQPAAALGDSSSGSETEAASQGSSEADPVTGGLVGSAARSTTAFRPLSSEPNPPAPPVVQERSVQVPERPPPAIYSPVASAPEPQTSTPPAPSTPPQDSFGGFEPDPLPVTPPPVRVAPAPTPPRTTTARPATPPRPRPAATPTAAPAPQTYTPPQDPFGGFEPDVLPVTPPPVRATPASAPARTTSATAARPTPIPRLAPSSTAPARPTATTATPQPAPARNAEAPDLSTSFGALPVMPPPVDPPVPSSSPDAAAATPAVSAVAFGNVQETAPVTAPPPADTTAFSSGVVYERAPKAAPTPGAASPSGAGTLAAETPFGSDATNPASRIGATGPFKPLQQVPATLMTAIRTPNGGSVPVVAVTADGGSFVGLATINAALARVDMQFRRYVAADGQIYAVDALAYSRDAGGLTQGLAAEIQAVAPTLALDAAQNSANALNSYVQNAAAAAAKSGQGTSVNIGDNLTLSGPSVATLAQTLVGGLGSTFRMPENTQSVTRIATVKGNLPMIVIAGLGGEGR